MMYAMAGLPIVAFFANMMVRPAPISHTAGNSALRHYLNRPFLIWESGAWRPTAPLGRFGLVSAVDMGKAVAVSLSVKGALERRARGRGTPLREASQNSPRPMAAWRPLHQV